MKARRDVGAKVFHCFTVQIDLSLAPEPTLLWEVSPNRCAEHERWHEATTVALVSATRFGVHRRLPKSSAGNRLGLGCRWVFK